MSTFHVGLQAHVATFSSVKDKFINKPFPSWTAVGVTELAVPGTIVEIKVIARRRS
jgi:enamine deaminase RidA (YjgF/YER057c/UK114 family)